MAIERMTVTNHERWGNLVKTWSTGKNYLEDGNEYPIPESVDEFKEQLAKAQVFMTVPERFKQIKFVAQEQDTIVVRLPPKVMIADSEERLSQPGATYPLPPFYKRLFNGMEPVIPEEREIPGACGTHRRLYDQPLFLNLSDWDSWGNTLDRKPCATQSSRAGLPIAMLYTDRMRLQDPPNHGLVGRHARSNPKRSDASEKALSFLRAP